MRRFFLIAFLLLLVPAAAQAQNYFVDNDPRNPVQVDLNAIYDAPPPAPGAPQTLVIDSEALPPPQPQATSGLRSLKKRALTNTIRLTPPPKAKTKSKPATLPQPPRPQKPVVKAAPFVTPPKPPRKPVSLTETTPPASPPVKPATKTPEAVKKPAPPVPEPLPVTLPEPAPTPAPAPAPKPVPEPPAEPTPAPEPETPEIKHVTPANQADIVRLVFADSTSDLDATAAESLDSVIAALDEKKDLRLQLMAYAKGKEGAASSARRLSLSRALAVRAYLMDNGIGPTRVDVRAMGSNENNGPADRVDVIFVE